VQGLLIAGKVAEKLRVDEFFVVEPQMCDSDDMAPLPIRRGTHQSCREPLAVTAFTKLLIKTATKCVEGL
jgi:hypothetical protein